MRSADCPRCEGCDRDEPHHWMEDGNTLTGVACKHCPAIAVECCACAGGGVVDSEDGPGEVPCPECGGKGIVEVEVKHAGASRSE